MDEFEKARRKREKNALRFQKTNPEYGKTILEGGEALLEIRAPVVASLLDPVPKYIVDELVRQTEPPKKKEVDGNGYIAVQVRVGDVDALLKFRIRSMRGNFPGQINEANLRAVIREALVSKFGNFVENA